MLFYCFYCFYWNNVRNLLKIDKKKETGRSSGAIIVNFEHSHYSGVSIADFKQVNAGWGNNLDVVSSTFAVDILYISTIL